MKKLIAIILLSSLFAVGAYAANEPKVSIYFGENAQFELISPEGTRVLIDVHDPSALTKPATEDDILLTTHKHGDHVNAPFLNKFQGKQLFVKIGDITAGDVTIKGIASSHSSLEEYLDADGSNYIFIIETAGLRIAHFGDIGQDKLTPDQLAVLGNIDIALTQLDNSYSNMNLQNKKGFNLMDQVNPKLIVPTHLSEDTAKFAITKWQGKYAEKPNLQIGKSNLTNKTQIIFMGALAKYYGKTFKIPKCSY